MNRVAIVTALCGNRESLVNPPEVFPNADYHAFVSKWHPDAKKWIQHEVAPFSNDPKYALRRNAKIYKILPQLFIPNYEYYIWHDVSHNVISEPEAMCDQYLKGSDIGCFKHTQRNCIYDEGQVLKELKYDHIELLEKQIEFYRSRKYPANIGLFEMSAFICRNTPAILTLKLKWWDNICRYSSRDQLSFMYALWETGISPAVLPGFANGMRNNPLVTQTRQHVPSGV
jgi:hypothetical protein